MPSAQSEPLRLGIAGLGTVGVGVVRIIRKQAALLEARTGRAITISAVSARSKGKDRGVTCRTTHGKTIPSPWPRAMMSMCLSN